MILGLGCDIVNIERIEKSAEFLAHFERKILSDEELVEVAQKAPKTMREKACLLAKYYAGKEAFAKALGTGFIDGIFLRDIRILHDALGKPELKIFGGAAAYLHKLSTVPKLFVSLSDDYPYALAMVVIEQE